jgi:hypothetical protein
MWFDFIINTIVKRRIEDLAENAENQLVKRMLKSHHEKGNMSAGNI